MVVDKTVELARTIGLKTLVILSLSSMLGSGLFLLPAFAHEVVGPGMWFAFLLAGSVVIASAYSKAELASAMPLSGGFYVYAERTYGHLIGTISGLGLFASFMLKSAFALVGFAAYMEVVTEHFGWSDVNSKAIAMVLLALILIVNLTGVKAIKKVQIPIVTGAMAMVAVLCVMALFSGDMDYGRPVENFQPVSLEMGTAAALVFVAFSGAIKVGAIGGEVMDPETNLPRGMIQSLVIATVLYAVVAYIMVAVMDPGDFMVDNHAVENPISVFADSVAGTLVVLVASLVAIIAMASMALAGVLSSSRFLYAMAKDGVLPAPLGELNERYKTPHWPVLVTGILMAVSIYSFDVHVIAELASGFILMVFIVLNLTVVVLRGAGPKHEWNPTYRSPMYPLPQIYGTLAGLMMLVLMGKKALYGGSGAVLLGLVAWFAYGRRNVQPREGSTPLSAFLGRDEPSAEEE
ncbi:MAG: APC family permease [Candidatus Thermoplasmatota archaeon]|nr:APC family permease [Candidatus Thermoplasmatota archaeon]GIR75838.1 MAG: hypothetical protein CM15mP78_05370 [Candidatus Poseidoniales archaeon]MEC7503867.1 APC family permease [Candidatus Thermoplasmatota archaeon]MEC7600543.1 APC family permease [Candidatus Thermoplasmatota archaeon]MEC8576229.1 APC family permease [Candidatus Thermoplasmatota archaeon]